MNLPNYIRTRAEAQSLAADIFPGERAALERLKPGITHPRYHLTHATNDTLREVLLWLHERKPRIYRRARWYFFYDLAQRLIDQVDENGQAKVSQFYAEDRAEKRRRHEAEQIMTGDGQGI
jgi:hypothetical protein